MNPGETRPWEEDDAELGEALHQRLSQLAARLERLTAGRDNDNRTAGTPIGAAQRASDAFADDPALDDSFPIPPGYGRRDGQRIPQPRPPGKGKADLAEIASALQDLDPDQPPPRPKQAEPDHEGAKRKLRSIRDRIDALKSRHGETTPPPPPPSRQDPASLRSRNDSFNAAVAEIAARQRHIDGDDRWSPETAAPRRFETANEAERKISDTVADLRRRVEDLSRTERPAAEAHERDRSPTPELDTAALEALNRQLIDIRAQMQDASRRDDVSVLAAGNAAILDRLEQLMSRAPGSHLEEAVQQIVHRVPSSERFDALSAEIDRLSERIGALDQRPDLSRIEERLAGLEQQLAGASPEAVGPRLEAEMAGLRDAVEGLAHMFNNSGSPALSRLEAKLNQVHQQFEATLAAAPRADTVSDLLDRLETIAARGETAPAALEALASEIAELRARERTELASLDNHIQALAQRLDEAIAGQGSGANAVVEFESRLAALSARLDELGDSEPSEARLAEIAQVEEQLAQLSTRLDQVDSGIASDSLGQLETQVASLMDRLEELTADRDTLREVQDNLTRLEALVRESGPGSIDAIKDAARQAVEELGNLDSGHDPAIVASLKADLRELQEAARSNDRQTSDSLSELHQTLDRVVNRLGALESDLRRPPQPAASPPPAEPADRPQVAATPVPPPLTRRADIAEDDAPLLPGSARARPGGTQLSDRDRRADFIAAARRAAQAAAAEHGAMRRVVTREADEDAEPGTGPFAKLRRFVRDRRRPLLLAAAAIVIAIAAIQVLKPFTGNDQAEPAPVAATAPAAEPAAIAEVPAPAAPETAPAEDPPTTDPPVITIPPPAEAAAPQPAANTAAFIPPAGVTSPVNNGAPPAATTANGTYPEPDAAIGGVRLRVAAAEGDPAALYEVGARYADGVVVPRDLAEAAIWLERAAEAGLAVAQHRLATLYEAGLGVPENRPLAAQWYQAAADQGNVLAMHNLGVMYSQGIDGSPDFTTAVEWFTAAADHGIRDSQYNLGVIYARGIGVDADLVASYKWFAIAAAQGDTDAAARRDDVAAALSPEELATARAAVSAWSQLGAPAAANTVDVPEGGWDTAEERVELVDRVDLVQTVQGLLLERGFNPGPADGVIGPMTRDAVRAFQQAIGMQPTGVIDEGLLNALQDRAA